MQFSPVFFSNCSAVGRRGTIYATQDMPQFGDPNAPIHRSATADHYINKSYDDSHIPNIVTTVLASYRGYDTLGETTVVYTAALAVMMLLGRRKEERKSEVVKQKKSDAIPLLAQKMVIPYILFVCPVRSVSW